MKKNIKLTIESFFCSVDEQVNRVASLYTKQDDKQAIEEQKSVIKSQREKVEEMIKMRAKGFDAYKLGQLQHEITTMTMPGYQAFTKPGNVDDSVLVAYRNVISGITEYLYYDLREETFLVPLKQWKCIVSDKPMKNLMYHFLPLKFFMEKDEKEK